MLGYLRSSLFLPVTILSLLACFGCGDGTGIETKAGDAPPDLSIMFIGIDALDWEMLRPLVNQNRTPNFRNLVLSGASTQLNTNDIGGSAVFWTTIATGVHRNKHGIKAFVIKNPITGEQIPYTSNMRKTKAFWNILSERGITTGIVGWFVSWPAEEVNGFMVSSYLSITGEDPLAWKGTIYRDRPSMVYPPGLEEEVDGYIENAEEGYETILRNIIKPAALEENHRVVQETKWAFLSDEIFREAGLELYHSWEPRVFAVYFEALDVVGHRFTTPDSTEQEEIYETFGDVHEKYYLYMDHVLGQYMSAARPNTIIIISSDHGLMRGEHTDNGVFIIAGPVIRKNVRLQENINLTDICPTILYLMGQPVAADMDGRVFAGALEAEYLVENEIRYIETYGARESATDTPVESSFDEEYLERLRTLGYIE